MGSKAICEAEGGHKSSHVISSFLNLEMCRLWKEDIVDEGKKL